MAQARTTSSAGNEARIGGGTRIVGRVTGEGNLFIEGRVEGEISVRGDLEIDPTGVVVSDIDARSVTVAGSLEGDVTATGPVAVRSGARVRGDLRGSEVTIEEGAQFAGRLDCEFSLPEGLEATAGRR